MHAGVALAALASFENVHKSFPQPAGPSLEVVAGIELDIAAGDFITILGPSGCGKSTLLNMLAGIFSPTSGRVLYRGVPVNGLNLATGYMTQNDHLLPWRTIAHKCSAPPLEINHVARAAADRRVAELLEIVGLSAFARSYPSQVSGGMRKRAALARLLAYDPETLLLDEPFVALDAQLRLVMQSELRSLCRRLGNTGPVRDPRCRRSRGARRSMHHLHGASRPHPQDRRYRPTSDRDVMRLRQDPRYSAISASLWEEMASEDRSGPPPGAAP